MVALFGIASALICQGHVARTEANYGGSLRYSVAFWGATPFIDCVYEKADFYREAFRPLSAICGRQPLVASPQGFFGQ